MKKRLGEMLLEAGAIDEAQLQAALGHQRKWGGKLGQALLDLQLTTEAHILAALSKKFGYQAVSLATLPRTLQLEAALKLVPRELALRQMLLPVSCDSSSVQVAMADPSNIAVIDELAFRTGRRVRVVLAGDRDVAAAVRRFYFADDEASLPVPPPRAPPSPDAPAAPRLETTTDPFAAMPDHIREGYFNRPANTLAEAEPAASSRPRGAGRLEGFAQGSPSPLTEEPVLLTELAPEAQDEGPAEGPPAERAAVLRRSAVAEALDQLARGERGGLSPGQLMAAVTRLLLRRGLLTESELMDELYRR